MARAAPALARHRRTPFIIIIPPPPVRGIGTAGGFKMMVQDQRGRGLAALEAATQRPGGGGQPARRGWSACSRSFNTRTPSSTPISTAPRPRCSASPPSKVFDDAADLSRLDLRQRFQLSRPHLPGHRPGRRPLPRGPPRDRQSARRATTTGEMVPLGSVATFRDITGPYRVPRYNLYPAAEIQGDTAPGDSTGQALAAMERLAAEHLPDGFGYEWTELAYQQKLAGNTGILVFGASRGVRLPGAGGAVRELGPAARGDADRADVPAGRGQRRQPARHGQQHPGADRLRRAGRPGGQERHPDRRVRAPGRGAGRGSLRGRGRRRRAPGCGRS